MEAGEYEAALEKFTAAISLDPHLRPAYRARAGVLRRLGRLAEAQQDFDAADSIAPGESGVRDRGGGGVIPDWGAFIGGASYRRGFLWTAAPLSALALVSTAAPLEGAEALVLLWFAALLGVALVMSVHMFLTRRNRGQTAAGVSAGVGVTVLTLGVTCFINIYTASG